MRQRDHLDPPYFDQVLGRVLPALRPACRHSEVFVTRHSSGGNMAVRAASRLDDRITATAPVSSDDPYGWTRDRTPRAGDRPKVVGAGFDNESRRQVIEPGAWLSATQPNEKPQDGAPLLAHFSARRR